MCRYFTVLTAIVLFISNGTAQGNDYQIPEIRIETELLKNGTVSITEHLTYHFEGSYSWADHRFPKRGFDSITNIRVSENGFDYLNENSEEPGSFSVSESDRDVIIKWHYSATDTVRTFSISYDLIGALTVGTDWVEFFWSYLASGRNKSTDTFLLEIHPPSPVSTDSVYVWDRLGPDYLNVTSPEGSISITVQDISRNQSVRFRFLYPRSLFDETSLAVNEPDLTLANVIREEEAHERELEQRAERQEWIDTIAQPITAVLSVLSILIYILIYKRFGKRFETNLISNRETVMIPDKTAPALIGKLIGSSITTNGHLMATIFDLARKGYFKIREEKNEKAGIFSTSDSEFIIERTETKTDESGNLPEWEAMVVQFVYERTQFESVSLKKLFSKNPSEVSRWFNNWKKELRKVYDGQNWIDIDSTKGVALNAVLQLILAAASVYLLFLGGDIALAALGISVIMLILSFAIKRRTEKGEEKYRRWKAYRNGLKNADKRTLRMDTLDRHFIYATAFGFTPNQIESILKKAEGDQFASMIPWIVLMSGSKSSPANIASSVSALAATGGSSFSGSISGTGASMGSAGGGASSGAG